MLSKLAFQNAKRSLKDYAIYLITITLSFSFMFAFHFISNSSQVLELNSTMENFKSAMSITNIFIVLVICFLIHYTTKFMLQKRSKEFGTYQLLGICKKEITKMFLLENIILGFIAFLMAVPIGYLISIFLSYIIMNIFNLPELVSIDIGKNAIVFPSLYFIIIYIIVLFLARRQIKKRKIYDLIYFEKQNEKRIHKKDGCRNIIFFCSLIMGIIAFILFDRQFLEIGKEPSFSIILISLILIIISIYGVSITLPDFVLNAILKKKNLKYKGNYLFLARTFSSKIKSMSITIGTLTVLITFTLIALNLSSLMKGMFEYQINLTSPYDIAMELEEAEIDEFLAMIEKEYEIKEQLIYHGYEDKNKNIQNAVEIGWRTKTRVIALSDFNKLLTMKKNKPIALNEDEYYLSVTKEYESKFLESLPIKEISLSNGITLKQKGVTSAEYTSSWGVGYGYLLVVPDQAITRLDILDTHLIVNTKENTTEEFANKLMEQYQPDLCESTDFGYDICYNLGNIEVKGKAEAMNKGFMTISSFVCFYFALIFTAVVGTILAIHSLSDATKYKYHYQVLNKLGVPEKELHNIIFKQLSIFFLFPLIYPVIISFFTIFSMNRIFQIALTNEYIYLSYFCFSFIIFFLIYAIYFFTTYFGFKRNIENVSASPFL